MSTAGTPSYADRLQAAIDAITRAVEKAEADHPSRGSNPRMEHSRLTLLCQNVHNRLSDIEALASELDEARIATIRDRDDVAAMVETVTRTANTREDILLSHVNARNEAEASLCAVQSQLRDMTILHNQAIAAYDDMYVARNNAAAAYEKTTSACKEANDAFDEMKATHDKMKANHDEMKATHDKMKADHDEMKADRDKALKQLQEVLEERGEASRGRDVTPSPKIELYRQLAEALQHLSQLQLWISSSVAQPLPVQPTQPASPTTPIHGDQATALISPDSRARKRKSFLAE